MTLAAETLLRWTEHPAQMVRDLGGVTPHSWQEDVLEAFPHRQRIAMPASKGVGKTATLSWLAINFLLTRPHPRIAVASISAQNLADNFWTETIAWIGRSEILKSIFETTKSRIFSRENPETWWLSARSWSQSSDATEQANVLSGLHADYV